MFWGAAEKTAFLMGAPTIMHSHTIQDKGVNNVASLWGKVIS